MHSNRNSNSAALLLEITVLGGGRVWPEKDSTGSRAPRASTLGLAYMPAVTFFLPYPNYHNYLVLHCL